MQVYPLTSLKAYLIQRQAGGQADKRKEEEKVEEGGQWEEEKGERKKYIYNTLVKNIHLFD